MIWETSSFKIRSLGFPGSCGGHENELVLTTHPRSLGGGQVGYRETMFAKVLPRRLVGLKLIDTLSFGVNPGYLPTRAFFARVGTGGWGAVKGQIRGGFEVFLVVSEIK